MQIEKDGVVYEVVEVVDDPMTDEERQAVIAQDEEELSQLWDIYIDDSWSPVMKDMLEGLQKDIDERREFLEGEIVMLMAE